MALSLLFAPGFNFELKFLKILSSNQFQINIKHKHALDQQSFVKINLTAVNLNDFFINNKSKMKNIYHTCSKITHTFFNRHILKESSYLEVQIYLIFIVFSVTC